MMEKNDGETDNWMTHEKQLSDLIKDNVLVKGCVNISQNKVDKLEKITDRTNVNLDGITTLVELQRRFSTLMTNESQWQAAMRFSRDALMRAFENGTVSIYEPFQITDKTGLIHWICIDMELGIDSGSGDVYSFFAIRDIDTKRRNELRLPERPEYDAVTRLYSLETLRRFFTMCNASARAGTLCALVVFDIRNFNYLRNQFSEKSARNLLQDIGRTLVYMSKTEYLISYRGNGQYVIFVPDARTQDRTLDRLNQSISAFYSNLALTGVRSTMRYALGFSMGKCESAIFDDLLQEAVIASQRNGLQSKDLVTIYSDEQSQADEEENRRSSVGMTDYDARNTFAACVTDLRVSDSRDDSIRKILERVGGYYQADRVYIGKYDQKTGLSSNTVFWCAEGVSAMADAVAGYDLASASPNMVKMILEKQDRLYVEDVLSEQTEPAQRELMRAHGIELMYMIPFSVDDLPYGFFGIDNPRDHLRDRTLMDALAFLVENEMSRSSLINKESYLDWHDDMTGLLNRRGFMRFREKFTPDSISSLGVVSLDINGLKRINQDYGYAYGDSMLKHAANVLQHVFGSDNVYRLAGDELLVLAPDFSKEKFQSCMDEIEPDLDKVRPGMASIGSTWKDIDINLDELVKHAEELRLLAKENSAELSESVSKKYLDDTVANLIKSINAGEFLMHLQPKADINSGKVIGAEALVRYSSNQYGMIPPGRFIPMLEKENLVHYVDLFMFKSVIETLQSWKSHGLKLIPISLNFSRSTILTPNLLERMDDIYHDCGVPRDLIEIEITETIGDMEQNTITTISDQICQAGYHISLDDFGAKYSNLSILTLIRFHMLKLDKSLTNSLTSNKKTQIIVSHVIDLCKALETKIIAEGVETDEQRLMLRGLGCQYMQGYLINKAIPVDIFEKTYLTQA